MSQSDRLPSIKKIELTTRQMRPPEGSKAVDTLPDGTVVWEGQVFRGNPYFQDHSGPSDSGVDKVPVLDPITKEQKWRRAKATGEPIIPIFKARRGTKTVRFVMVDNGNGNAGPRPVPGMSAEEREHREHEANRSSYQDAFFAAAQAEGIPAADLVKRLAALSGEGEETPQPKRRGRPPKDMSVDG